MKLKFSNGTAVPVFVAHVKKGYEERRVHIERHLQSHGIDFEFMLNGDIPDITSQHLERYFKGQMKTSNGITSCALKHFFICEEIINRNYQGALILEDDIFLSDNFTIVFNATMKEAAKESLDDQSLMISYENSNLKFIPADEQVKDRFLYRRDKGRCTGAYFVNRTAAQKIIDHAVKEKCGVPIDYFHNDLSKAKELNIYWCHPTVAEQGSHNGLFASGIAGRKKGFVRRLKWLVQKFYKANIWTPKK